MEQLKIQIIIGTTRPGRFSQKAADWIYVLAQKRKDIDSELVDLRDYPLPFYNESLSPKALQGKYDKESVKKWAEKISQADGYIIVTGEYNHGYPAVLKNALDYIYFPWNNKPVGFISYGTVGGARSVEQLRQVAIELVMTPIRESINIPFSVYRSFGSFEPWNDQAKLFLDQLTSYTKKFSGGNI